MPWNSVSPVGNISVKSNRTTMNQNTTYIETTMGNSAVGTNTTSTRDHFWDVGSDEDGRHRFIQSPAFTVGGVPTDPVIGTGMDCVEYPKTVAGRVERFHRNAQGIYQHVPSFLQGTVSIPSTGSFTTVVAVPANVYGEMYLYTSTATGPILGVRGYFVSNNDTVCAWTSSLIVDGLGSTDTTSTPLVFASVFNTNGLNIRARREDAGSLTWTYRITYRAR